MSDENYHVIINCTLPYLVLCIGVFLLVRKKIYKCVGITFPKKWLLVINDLGKEQYYDIMDFVILDSLR